jgi:isoleucyl-tRNA synthetase
MTTPRFTPLPPERSADALEQEMLVRWTDERLFEQTLEATRDGTPYVFYEGPPTANGRPGIHHVFARTIKDLFCRHRAMRGYRVPRKAGWDTHGLPVEIEVEKQLGISGKQQIEAIGVAEFNRLCRESVFRYRNDWERLSERIAYWLDYRDPYVTYTNEYVESVWWSLATLFEKDLLYRGHKILPYCSRCGTALSSHEMAQGYEDVEDPSVYVALPILGADGATTSQRRILVWTTTPWTLVSNTALAVHPELPYVELMRKVSDDKRTIILAESRVPAVLGTDWEDRWSVVGTMPGTTLIGLRYRRPLDWVAFPEDETQHEIVVGEEFVSAGDGTGVVHMSPAFGADDYAAGKRHRLSFLQPVNLRGEFPDDMPLVGGRFVKHADPMIIEELERRGVLWKAGRLLHPYPHCWRCGTPLIYYARESWFVRTTAYKDEMLARNAAVDWHPPAMGEGRFGQWLENNIDWTLSRDRYWGTPLPIWTCDADSAHVQAIGSFAALAERTRDGALPKEFDPHKPFIDEYSWPCPHGGCGGTMKRATEVIDTWYDSGSMPFAQWHYPFENREKVEAQYPADFIAEGVDQTRGWFYSLLAIATGLGDALPNNEGWGRRAGGGVDRRRSAPAAPPPTPAAPYRAVVVNDLVLDAEGKKMSKSIGNVVNPWEVIERHGADAVRLFLVSSSNPWMPRRFDERAIREVAGRFLLTLKNVYSGIFAQYANFGWEPSDRDPGVGDRPALDRWVLSRLATVEREVDDALERYDATAAAQAVMTFLDADVANWYVRLSRHRFYEVDSDDNRAAFATLHEVLLVTSRLLAPFTPFLSDWLHRELAGTSVHLAPFVRDSAHGADSSLEARMAAIRAIATLGRSAREERGIKVRQPLARLVCIAPGLGESDLRELLPLLASELNVKQVDFAASGAQLVHLEAKANFRSLGKRFGKATPVAAREVARLDDAALQALERGETVTIRVDDASHHVLPEDVEIQRHPAGDLVVHSEAGFFAAIDPAITPELRSEGMAREVVSRVQRLRKEAGLAVSDRIALAVASASTEVRMALETHRDWIAEEVLAAELSVHEGLTGTYQARQTVELDDATAEIAITKVG